MQKTYLSVVFAIFSSVAAAQDECKNILFAAPDNQIVVFVHSGDDDTSLTEVREGEPSFCDASWIFGMGAYNVTCNGRSFIMRSVTDGNDIEYDGTILERQCAR